MMLIPADIDEVIATKVRQGPEAARVKDQSAGFIAHRHGRVLNRVPVRRTVRTSGRAGDRDQVDRRTITSPVAAAVERQSGEGVNGAVRGNRHLAASGVQADGAVDGGVGQAVALLVPHLDVDRAAVGGAERAGSLDPDAGGSGITGVVAVDAHAHGVSGKALRVVLVASRPLVIGVPWGCGGHGGVDGDRRAITLSADVDVMVVEDQAGEGVNRDASDQDRREGRGI